MSIIDEHGGRRIRMANLACVGSHSINGVAALHSELLKTTVLHDFYDLWPKKFSNKTNGVTPRRFMALANPGMSRLITGSIGDGWINDLNELRKLEQWADDDGFREQWRQVKLDNKRMLAREIEKRTGISVNPESMFDIHAKRIHEYKRQHLNLLHIISLYLRIQRDPSQDIVPRTFIFAGKAAPGYFLAKRIIKLVNSIGELVNNDPLVDGRIKVAFFPDFNVKSAQHIYPAADLSEQISTAGKEASGTGNMKFALNGALTIGTLDGANVEMREAVGVDNFFLFGLTAESVMLHKASGYKPWEYVAADDELAEVLNMLTDERLSHGNKQLFEPIARALYDRDEYMLLADYHDYIKCQQRVSDVYTDQERWTRMSILNVARMGKFSSDRAIAEYCRDIWEVEPVAVEPSE
jgi:starch phosphorylase